MPATRLIERRFAKPWGRRDLPAPFGAAESDGQPIGEVWFVPPEGANEHALLVKYLFTSERLSIQVHPDDEAARGAGLRSGKDESWLVIEAVPDAEVALGLKAEMTPNALRSAASNGTLEQLVEWRTAASGDFFFSPGGTIHALGAGLTLIEVQQNVDLTWRLYDYGRPRELHLDQAVAVAAARPWVRPAAPFRFSAVREILASGLSFVQERWTGPISGRLNAGPDRPAWMVMLDGTGRIAGSDMPPHSVWHVDDMVPIELSRNANLLVAYSGAAVRADLLEPRIVAMPPRVTRTARPSRARRTA